MKISESFPAAPSEYLKTTDLGGRAVTVTIADVAMRSVRDDKGRDVGKPVVYFRNAQKGWILNKTCAAALVEITGSDLTEDWIDVRVVLYPTKTPFGGKM